MVHIHLKNSIKSIHLFHFLNFKHLSLHDLSTKYNYALLQRYSRNIYLRSWQKLKILSTLAIMPSIMPLDKILY